MTDNLNSNLIKHYKSENLIENIEEALKSKGLDIDNLKPEDLVAFEEFHIGGRKATKQLASLTDIRSSMKVLDIGCGIGGPARTLCLEYGCEVTGIDISQDYINAANYLSDKLGLSDKTKFVCSVADEISFENDSFDLVWSQHLTMNIKDKQKLLTEIKRVLKPDGVYLFHEAFVLNGRELKYPVFWADSLDVSFMVDEPEFVSLLESSGFNIDILNDVTDEALRFFEKVLSYHKSKGLSKLGLSLLVPQDYLLKVENMYENLRAGDMRILMGKVSL